MYSNSSITVPMTATEISNYIYSNSSTDLLSLEVEVLERRLRDIKSIRQDELVDKLGGDKWIRRKSRRAMEIYTKSGMIPCGPWDEDLDLRHDDIEYEVKLPSEFDGYRAYARRNFYTWTWNGYVTTPKNHTFRTLIKNDDFMFFYDQKIPFLPPQEITYINNGTFGWDHARSHECCPCPRRGGQPHMTGYIDFDGISQECIKVAEWLKACNEIKDNPSTSTDCKCAGCVYDYDCTGDEDCDCLYCRPTQKRICIAKTSSSCLCDDYNRCACYGCMSCVLKRKNTFVTTDTPTVEPPIDIDDAWVTVRRKRRGTKL